jgi:polyphosphate glucokinase
MAATRQRGRPAAARLGLGIDVGGTGVKAALVDLSTGDLLSTRVREKTPSPATPELVIDIIVGVVARVEAERPISGDVPVGCGLPGVVKDGRVLTAANIDKAWAGVSAEELVGAALGGRRVHALNDADAAGLAEMRFGAGRGKAGTVLLLTIGTGIGSALFADGHLMRNTEFGHIEYRGKDVELRLSGAARERRGLTWAKWAAEFNIFLAQLERWFWPDQIIIGGGVSKAIDKYINLLQSRAPIVPAQFRNTAGIIGAALAAHEVTAPIEGRAGRLARPAQRSTTTEPSAPPKPAAASSG